MTILPYTGSGGIQAARQEASAFDAAPAGRPAPVGPIPPSVSDPISDLAGPLATYSSHGYTSFYSSAPGEPLPVGPFVAGRFWPFNDGTYALFANSDNALTTRKRDVGRFTLVATDRGFERGYWQPGQRGRSREPRAAACAGFGTRLPAGPRGRAGFTLETCAKSRRAGTSDVPWRFPREAGRGRRLQRGSPALRGSTGAGGSRPGGGPRRSSNSHRTR